MQLCFILYKMHIVDNYQLDAYCISLTVSVEKWLTNVYMINDFLDYPCQTMYHRLPLLREEAATSPCHFGDPQLHTFSQSLEPVHRVLIWNYSNNVFYILYKYLCIENIYNILMYLPKCFNNEVNYNNYTQTQENIESS